MSETPLLDAQRIAEAEALARFGRDSNWSWTIGTLAFSAILSLTMITFLGMDIEDSEVRRAVMWTTTLATIAAYFVERGHMRKRDGAVGSPNIFCSELKIKFFFCHHNAHFACVRAGDCANQFHVENLIKFM